MDYSSPLFARPHRDRHAAGRSLTQEEQQEIEFAWKLLDGEGNGNVALKGLKVRRAARTHEAVFGTHGQPDRPTWFFKCASCSESRRASH